MRRDRALFEDTMLPNGGPRWRSFGAGAVVQFLIVIVLLLIPLLFPDRVVQLRRYLATEIAPSSPVVSAWQARRPRRLRRSLAAVAKPTELPIVHPEIPSPVPTPPRVKPVSAALSPEAPRMPAKPQIPIELSPSAIPHLQKPRESVRVGGFGDPSGFAGSKTSSASNVTQVGEFDLPAGSNGGGRRGRGAVQQGLFASEQAGGREKQTPNTVEVSARATPVEILFKPTPKYTQTALAKKIEGEVLLQVAFSTSGEVKVLRVVRGLGYGLDEAAEDAARRIRFRPAKNADGEPIDSLATVRVVFQLAY